MLEGSAEDREARLLARQQATARAIERAMHALAAEAPPAPSDAQLADPVRMEAYMEALSAHASRQQEALQSHEAEVRENRWISEQLEQLERGRRREAAALAERARQREIAARAAAEIAAEIAAAEISAPEIAAAEISAPEIAPEIAVRGGVDVVAPPALALAGGGIQLALARGGTGGGARAADMTAKLAPSPGCRSRDPSPSPTPSPAPSPSPNPNPNQAVPLAARAAQSVQRL